MSADNRSVATDAIATLGTIIGPWAKRDAIHVAVDPATAAHTLHPGQHVGFIRDETTGKLLLGAAAKTVGIVDPYLKTAVMAGQQFWLMLYPRQITSLRHVWAHPDFPEAEVAGEAVKAVEAAPVAIPVMSDGERWIRSYADSLGVEYIELLEHANNYLDYDEYWNEGGRFEGEYIRDEFWEHFEEVTGRKVAEKNQRNFFSCSC